MCTFLVTKLITLIINVNVLPKFVAHYNQRLSVPDLYSNIVSVSWWEDHERTHQRFERIKHIKFENCCNFSLRLMTKAKACKGVGWKWSSGVTFHIHGSVRECERMNPHTPKWALTLGVGIPMDCWIFKEQLQRSKLIGLNSSLYHWKTLETRMSKMGLHVQFAYLKHKLWLKEGSRVKVSIWLSTIKNQESPWFTYVQVTCSTRAKMFL
jgi:hypothetical protein